MRIIGFSKKWDKLKKPVFTTFRAPRKDSGRGYDWHLNEIVKVYYHNRCPDREYLGVAQIIDKTSTWLSCLDDAQAVADGFPGGISEMVEWMQKAHKIKDAQSFRINKLTLEWMPEKGK